MNNKIKCKKNTFVFFIFFFMFLFYPIHSRAITESIDFYPIDGVMDFEHKTENVKEWGEIQYNRWINTLNKEEIESLEVLNYPSKDGGYDINQILKGLGGNLERRPIDLELKEKNEKYKKDVKNIERALSREGSKLNEDLYVYKSINLADFIDSEDKHLTNIDGTINREKFQELKKHLLFSKNQEFTIVDLTETKEKNSGLLKWRIKLPKGVSVGHINKNQLILDRDIGLKISNTRIIRQSGKEFIRIEATLIPKERVDKMIEFNEIKLNQGFNSLLKLPSNSKMIEFRLHNLASSVISSQGIELLKDLGNQVDKDVLNRIINFMLEKNGKIIITDITPAAIIEAFAPKQPLVDTLLPYATAGGIYNQDNRTIVINALHSFQEGTQLNSGDLIHEFGHALDYYIGELVFSGKGVAMSESLGFEQIYAIEKNNLTDYAKTNSREFWAEAFQLMHSKKPEDIKMVKEKAHQTYKFINDILKLVKTMPLK
ncbi:ADP-ribosyltransferase [Bacillus cereus group sp. BfR-BA-01394]|uniref:anthrax toxin lethal factor-related metalloendopeptidase n=1 Tax=Bacillus cereus group sp. BfR-BA-01394 TaxID=2920331 RepID=UPI001F58F761